MAERPESSEVKRYDGLAAAEWIPEIVQRIVEGFDPEKIMRFGSHARGKADRWSDIDLLVVLPEVTHQDQSAVAIRRALRDFHVAKDIIVTDPEEIARRENLIGLVLRPALREGKVVYERE